MLIRLLFLWKTDHFAELHHQLFETPYLSCSVTFILSVFYYYICCYRFSPFLLASVSFWWGWLFEPLLDLRVPPGVHKRRTTSQLPSEPQSWPKERHGQKRTFTSCCSANPHLPGTGPDKYNRKSLLTQLGCAFS